ncbi:MAG: DUF523 domain-containing protein [Nitrospirae bacterium]|nr:DUF523 domain-containing protein [Nitrospirota bacterium]
MSKNVKLRIGISQCLLGDPVRYDGGHKRDALLADTLSRQVEWVPVCPEVEAGLGVPREPMRLEGTTRSPRLVTINTNVDHTTAMGSSRHAGCGSLNNWISPVSCSKPARRAAALEASPS